MNHCHRLRSGCAGGSLARLAEAFDRCLDDVLLHGRSVEDCLARWPAYAYDLEPVLRAAIRLAAAATNGAAELERARPVLVRARRPRLGLARGVPGALASALTMLATVLVAASSSRPRGAPPCRRPCRPPRMRASRDACGRAGRR